MIMHFFATNIPYYTVHIFRQARTIVIWVTAAGYLFEHSCAYTCDCDHQSLDTLVRGKELELEQAAEAYRNLQWLKQQSEEKERNTSREKDAIISQLQAALQTRSQETQVRHTHSCMLLSSWLLIAIFAKTSPCRQTCTTCFPKYNRLLDTDFPGCRLLCGHVRVCARVCGWVTGFDSPARCPSSGWSQRSCRGAESSAGAERETLPGTAVRPQPPVQ